MNGIPKRTIVLAAAVAALLVAGCSGSSGPSVHPSKIEADVGATDGGFMDLACLTNDEPCAADRDSEDGADPGSEKKDDGTTPDKLDTDSETPDGGEDVDTGPEIPPECLSETGKGFLCPCEENLQCQSDFCLPTGYFCSF